MARSDNPRRAITIKDIAKACNVHFMTVSRALRGDPKVRDATARRIRAAATEMGYDPAAGQAGRRLVSRAIGSRVVNQVVGIFFPPDFVRNTYFADLFEGIVEELTPCGFTLHIIPTYSPEHPERILAELPPILRRGEIDGVIVTEWPRHFAPVLHQLQEEPTFAERPIVSLMDEHPGCSAVLTDDFRGMYAAMGHLLDAGHRFIMHPYSPTDTHHASRQRLDAMRQACLDGGLDPDTHLVPFVLDWQGSRHQRMEGPLRTTLRQRPEITAVVAPNDLYALQAHQALAKLGFRVPDDISLLGFDDTIPLLDADHRNILSTVRLPLEDVGRAAARLILDQIAADGAPEQRNLVLPSELIVRDTSGPAPERAVAHRRPMAPPDPWSGSPR